MSKHLSLSFLAAASGVLFTLAAQNAAPLPVAPSKVDANRAAATTPSATPVAPPSDPFIREPRAQKAPVAPTVAGPPLKPVNLLTTIETWSLSQGDFVALLDGPADEGAPYARIEELAKTGKAKLLGLMALSARSGQRAFMESIDEVRYAAEFKPAEGAGEIALPTAWETRNTGDTLEVEAVLAPDGKTIDVTLVPVTVRLNGFEDWQPEGAAAPIGQPRFQTEKITTSATVQSGRPIFLSTATPAANSEGEPGTDVRIHVLRVTAQVAPPPPAPVTAAAWVVRLEFLLYTLDRATARRILAENADSAQSHNAVRELADKGEAELEVVRAFVTKSGQRMVSEEIAEMSYPTIYTPPSVAASKTPAEGGLPASSRGFETRNTGITVEIEPVIGADGRFVDINLVPQVISLAGMLKVEGIAAKYPPQPVFSTRKLSTSATSGMGVPVLLGTLSKPRDNGVNDRKDDGRTSLAYVRVTPVRP